MKYQVDHRIDAKGLACPMPIVRTKKGIDAAEVGQVVELLTTDKGSLADVKAWTNTTGHEYLGSETEGNVYKHYIRKTK